MIILLANKFFHLNGGSEFVFFHERNYLLKNGYKVIDFSMQDKRNLPSPFSMQFVPNISYRVSDRTLNYIKKAAFFVHSPVAVKKIKELVEKEKPEIAHLHNIYHHLTPSIIPILKSYGIKVIMTLHDGKLICPAYNMLNKNKLCVACKGKFFWKPIIKNCQRSLAREVLLSIEAYFHKWKKSYEYVDRFLVPSNFYYNLISMRFDQKKIAVLFNGVDLRKYTTSFSSENYALYYGRISKEKGIETLLKAHQSFQKAPGGHHCRSSLSSNL